MFKIQLLRISMIPNFSFVLFLYSKMSWLYLKKKNCRICRLLILLLPRLALNIWIKRLVCTSKNKKNVYFILKKTEPPALFISEYLYRKVFKLLWRNNSCSHLLSCYIGWWPTSSLALHPVTIVSLEILPAGESSESL